MYKAPQKKHPLKQKPYKNKAYLSHLHTSDQKCLVCGSYQIEVHHLDAGALGRADNKVVILCPKHHRDRFSPHGADSNLFYEKYPNEYLYEVAETLFSEYTDGLE